METSEAELKALMLAAMEGDARAYRALLTDLRPRLWGYFNRRLQRDPGEVDDLVQDTLLALHKRRETYDRLQPFTPWIYAIARYRLIDHYRRTGRRAFIQLDDAYAELRAEDASAAAEARKDVETALASLPERTRMLLRRLKLEELTVLETAELMDMSEGAVKVASHRAMKTLNARFEGGQGEHD